MSGEATERASGRAGLFDAAIWAVFGAVLFVAAWRMDRLDSRGINPLSIPGLLPGLVAVLMLLLAGALAWQARSGGAGEAEPSAPGSARRTLGAGALCLAFAAGTLGQGAPFVVDAALFIFVFSAAFSWSAWHAPRQIVRGLLRCALVAACAAVFIAWLFESVFLVRLP